MEVDISADLTVSLDGLSRQIKRVNDRADRENQRRIAGLPRQVPQIRALTSPQQAGVAFTVDFDGPQPGRIWEVRLLGAISQLAGAYVALATTPVLWHVGVNTPVAAGILPPQTFRWGFFAGIPARDDFSGDQIAIRANEHLIAAVTGVPAPPFNIQLIAVIDDLPAFTGTAEAAI